MGINELLETYKSLRTEDANPQHRYQRGSTSLVLVWQEIFYNKLPISQFNLPAILMYGIVSLDHPEKSPEWKFEEARRGLASIGGAVRTGPQINLQIK